MATLRADIEKLEESVKILCEILPQFDELKYDVGAIASELHDTWDGAASDHFVAKLRSHVKPLGDTKAALEYFMEYASEAKYNMKKLDEIARAIATVPVVTPTAPPASTTHTSSSGATHGGGGHQIESSGKKTNSKTNTSKKNNSSKNIVEKAVEAITKPINTIVNGIKTLLGGKKK